MLITEFSSKYPLLIPFTISSTLHFAYRVVFSVITSLSLLNSFVRFSSLYQPPKIQLSFVTEGSVVIFSPEVTLWLSASLPPLVTKVTVADHLALRVVG